MALATDISDVVSVIRIVQWSHSAR